MKIVSVGDIFIKPKIFDKAISKFDRYDISKTFFYGPDKTEEMRAYIKKMEEVGFNYSSVPSEILKEIEDTDVLQVHMMPVPSVVFEVARNLKIVASNRGGTENINIEAATANGIPVICNPIHNANAVAEMTIGLIIAASRNICLYNVSMTRDHKWLEPSKGNSRAHELKYMVVGVIGFGTIGSLLIKKLIRGFNCNVLVTDPYVDPEAISKLSAKLVDLDTLLSKSDFICMMARVNEETKDMIGWREFKLMKPTSIFVNTARPSLVDTKALVRALQKKLIKGAAIDVFDEEPISPDNPLLYLNNVILTCHKAGDTIEAFENSPETILHEVERYFNKEVPNFLINPQVLSRFK